MQSFFEYLLGITNATAATVKEEPMHSWLLFLTGMQQHLVRRWWPRVTCLARRTLPSTEEVRALGVALARELGGYPTKITIEGRARIRSLATPNPGAHMERTGTPRFAQGRLGEGTLSGLALPLPAQGAGQAPPAASPREEMLGEGTLGGLAPPLLAQGAGQAPPAAPALEGPLACHPHTYLCRRRRPFSAIENPEDAWGEETGATFRAKFFRTS